MTGACNHVCAVLMQCRSFGSHHAVAPAGRYRAGIANVQYKHDASVRMELIFIGACCRRSRHRRSSQLMPQPSLTLRLVLHGMTALLTLSFTRLRSKSLRPGHSGSSK